MELVLQGLAWDTCLLYLDDIIILSFEEHLQRLDTALSRIRQAGLKLKPSKCHLGQTIVKYLGHIVSREGVSTDPCKVQRICEWPVPRSVSDVRTFLGFAGYYRRFIAGFAMLSAPLTRLTEKHRCFSWTDTEATAFNKQRECLSNTLVLAYPRFDVSFCLKTDASADGLGAVLTQTYDDEERPVGFASRRMNPAEKNYSTTERELLAIIWGINHFRPYLYGGHGETWLTSRGYDTDQLLQAKRRGSKSRP